LFAFNARLLKQIMKKTVDSKETQRKNMKVMLDSFPSLKKKTIKYLKTTDFTTGNR
jgi:hypothetical protein